MSQCELCGRSLKSPESIARGVGPKCAQKIGQHISEAKIGLEKIKDVRFRKSKELEIAVAEHICDQVVMFNQKFGVNGEYGEIDAATKHAIIEVTISPNGKFTQTTVDLRKPPLNTTRKSVILHAPNYKTTPKHAVCHQGVRHTTNFDELDAALKSIQEWRGKVMDQAILLTNSGISEQVFSSVMESTGGKKLNDDRYFFAIGESHLWVRIDLHTLAEYEAEEIEVFAQKLTSEPKGCINVQLGHDVNLEEIRHLWAQWIERFNAVLVVDDEIITKEDLYDPGR